MDGDVASEAGQCDEREPSQADNEAADCLSLTEFIIKGNVLIALAGF